MLLPMYYLGGESMNYEKIKDQFNQVWAGCLASDLSQLLIDSKTTKSRDELDDKSKEFISKLVTKLIDTVKEVAED